MVRSGRGRSEILGADAKERHGARHLVEDVAEVLGPENRPRHLDELVVAEQRPRNVTGAGRLIATVDGHRLARNDIARTGTTVRDGRAVRDTFDALMYRGPCSLIERSDGALHERRRRNDVVRRTGLDVRNRHEA